MTGIAKKAQQYHPGDCKYAEKLLHASYSIEELEVDKKELISESLGQWGSGGVTDIIIEYLSTPLR